MYNNPQIVRNYQDLAVWGKGILLVKQVYRLTNTFPDRERYGLASQLQRAAVSIPSNLAEGSSKRSTKEFIRFINMAAGSVAEVETQIIIACELAYIDDKALQEIFGITGEINRMMAGLHKSLKDRLALQTTNHNTQNSELI